MRAADVVRLASESLALHRVRTGLTLTAIAIGLTSVLALTAMGEAAKRYVLDQFASVGSYLITVSPGRTESSGMGGMPGLAGERPLTIDDADAIRRQVSGAVRVVPLSLGTAPVEYGSRRRDVYLIGATAEFAVMRDLSLR
ncbi:MAG TPA: ABC transporter permease, partial [Gemmatimonadales bacterium]|nr:ABC transporter permease [Gemmatimonadales bacterium]